jgi:hypothetical protein
LQKKLSVNIVIISLMLFFTISVDSIDTVYAQGLEDNQRFDEKVNAFLENHKYRWQDMNVPKSVGNWHRLFRLALPVP